MEHGFVPSFIRLSDAHFGVYPVEKRVCRVGINHVLFRLAAQEGFQLQHGSHVLPPPPPPTWLQVFLLVSLQKPPTKGYPRNRQTHIREVCFGRSLVFGVCLLSVPLSKHTCFCFLFSGGTDPGLFRAASTFNARTPSVVLGSQEKPRATPKREV